MNHLKTAGTWVFLNVVPLVVVLGIGWVVVRQSWMDERLALHSATPAHAVQGERQDKNAERLARLEALMDALANGRAGHRWKSSDMSSRLWSWYSCWASGSQKSGLLVS